jgi:hypothetical protein
LARLIVLGGSCATRCLDAARHTLRECFEVSRVNSRRRFTKHRRVAHGPLPAGAVQAIERDGRDGRPSSEQSVQEAQHAALVQGDEQPVEFVSRVIGRIRRVGGRRAVGNRLRHHAPALLVGGM